MGGFLSFVKKEALHILRDKRTMLIVLLLPIVQILLFGFAISTEMNNIDFAVVAPNRTETIRQQIERMEANPYFTFKGYVSQAEVDDVLRKGDVTAVVVFSEDYDRLVTNAGIEGVSEAAVQFILDASNPNNAGTGLGYLQSSFQSGISAASVAPATRVLYNPQMKSSYNFVPGIMGLIFILICAMMTSVSIVREKEMVGLVGLSLLYLVLSLALGLFISTMANTQVTAMLISGMVLMLPIIMLSGMLFPVENMPGILQALSCIVPARWYIDAVRKLMIGGMPFAEVWQQACILFAMTAVLVGVALKKFNDKLE